jgi:hypothetical protein
MDALRDRRLGRLPGAQLRPTEGLLEAVPERVDADYDSILETHSLHEAVGTEIEDPHFALDLFARADDDSGPGRNPGGPTGDRPVIHLGRIAADRDDLCLTRSDADEPGPAANRLCQR